MTNLVHYKLEEIQNSFETYFQRLYSQPHVDRGKMEEFFEKINLPKLTGKQSNQLAVQITEKEIKVAIAHLKSGKAPGPDGFPLEWYGVLGVH